MASFWVRSHTSFVSTTSLVKNEWHWSFTATTCDI